MPERRRYRCLNCGNRFELEVLSEKETQEALRRNQRVSGVACPKCHSAHVEPARR
jgi:DNA-directed RNA polymerase subunit RPC12/RpoP